MPWGICTTRSLDITGQRENDTWVRDPERGDLKAEIADAEDKADVASDRRVGLVFRRRGLALEMADLPGWEAHARLR